MRFCGFASANASRVDILPVPAKALMVMRSAGQVMMACCSGVRIIDAFYINSEGRGDRFNDRQVCGDPPPNEKVCCGVYPCANPQAFFRRIQLWQIHRGLPLLSKMILPSVASLYVLHLKQCLVLSGVMGSSARYRDLGWILHDRHRVKSSCAFPAFVGCGSLGTTHNIDAKAARH